MRHPSTHLHPVQRRRVQIPCCRQVVVGTGQPIVDLRARDISSGVHAAWDDHSPMAGRRVRPRSGLSTALVCRRTARQDLWMGPRPAGGSRNIPLYAGTAEAGSPVELRGGFPRIRRSWFISGRQTARSRPDLEREARFGDSRIARRSAPRSACEGAANAAALAYPTRLDLRPVRRR